MVYLGCGCRCVLTSSGSLGSTERPVGVVCALLIRTRSVPHSNPSPEPAIVTSVFQTFQENAGQYLKLVDDHFLQSFQIYQ